LAHTLKAFEQCDQVDEVIVVVARKDLQVYSEEIIDRYSFAKVRQVVVGGAHRQESVYKGLRAVEPTTDFVVIHDGVRPFITPEQIAASIEACRAYGAVITAVPVKDTITMVRDGVVLHTPPRETLWAVQTPQTFALSLILNAHEKARSEGVQATDDAALVERLGHPVHILQGSYENIKITTPEDLALAEVLLSQRGARAPS